MSSVRELLSAQDRVVRLTDEAITDFERELADVLRLLERELRALVEDVADQSRTAVIKASRVARLRDQVREALSRAGYDDLIQAMTDLPLTQLAESVFATQIGKDIVTLMARLEPRVEALKALTLGDLFEIADSTANALTRATIQGVFSARPASEILTDLEGLVDDTAPHIRTLYDTSVSIYSRQVEALTNPANDPTQAFLYFGPVDNVIRPFCAARVGKVFTRADIDAMDNGQIPNVYLTGGGYNCRHKWVAISRYDELQEMIGTDQRLPEIEDALKNVTQKAKAA